MGSGIRAAGILLLTTGDSARIREISRLYHDGPRNLSVESFWVADAVREMTFHLRFTHIEETQRAYTYIYLSAR